MLGVMVSPGGNQPNNSLWPAVQYLLRCQVVAFVVFWLAIFAPVTCQYHGLLMDWFAPQPVHHHHSPSTVCAIAQPGLPAWVAPTCVHTLQGHQTTPDVTLIMSLFNVMIPGGVSCARSVRGTALPIRDGGSVVRWIVAPPEQPPRAA
jgi:hypothetical protein